VTIRRLVPVLILLLAAAGCGFGTQAPAARPPAPPVAKTTITQPPPPAAAVIIENAPQARPQSGLDHAQVIYEMMTEGGITRYLALFNLNAAQASVQVGPVRSARIYFVQLVHALGLPFAHAGGNVDALAAIGRLSIPNLDGLFAAAPYFQRLSSRPAPHNLYTTLGAIRAGIMHFAYPLIPLPTWPTGGLPAGGTPTAKATVLWAKNALYSYRTAFVWTGSTFQYYVNGQPDLQADGQPILDPTVVILQAVVSPDPDPYTPGSIKYALTSGPGWVLRQGQRFAITWSFGAGGFAFQYGAQTMPLAVGKVFVQVLTQNTATRFTP